MVRVTKTEFNRKQTKNPQKFTSYDEQKALNQRLRSFNILDASGWICDGIELPPLSPLKEDSIERLNDLLNEQVQIQLENQVLEFSLARLLEILIKGKFPGRIQLVGSELKRVLGADWFVSTMEKIGTGLQFETPSETINADLDLRFIISDDIPSSVVANTFLTSLISNCSKEQQVEYLRQLHKAFEYGQSIQEDSVLLRSGKLDLYICKPFTHTTLTHEDLVLDITDFLLDNNTQLQPHGEIKNGWQALIAYGLQLIQVTSTNRSTWSRAMYKQFQGWHPSPLPKKAYSIMESDTFIKKTQNYFKTKITCPKEQFQYLLLTTADLVSQNQPEEILIAYYQTLQSAIEKTRDPRLEKVRKLLNTDPIPLVLSALRVDSETNPFLRHLLKPISLQCAIRNIAGYDANPHISQKSLYKHFGLDQQTSLSANERLPFILIQNCAPNELAFLTSCYSNTQVLSQEFFLSAIKLLYLKDCIAATVFFFTNLDKTTTSNTNIIETMGLLASQLFSSEKMTTLTESFPHYIKMLEAVLKKTKSNEKILGERLRHDVALLIHKFAPLVALNLLKFSTQEESLIIREHSLWFDALKRYSELPHVNWHTLFDFWQIGHQFDIWGNAPLTEDYANFLTQFLTQLFKGTQDEALTASIYTHSS